ncbi:hypothetical protein, partial [Prevotella pallens]|uniref:hypothetical protein n=1 Tax=Prevotella pallens TaxID=60133 RepID=UPI0028D613E8
VMQGYGRDESAPTPGGVFATYFVGVRCIINKPLATKWQTTSNCRGRFIVPAYTKTPTKWGTNTRIRLCEYVYLVMQGYGRDESAPTPGGMFVTNFVGVRCIINNPLAALRQTVSSVIANR